MAIYGTYVNVTKLNNYCLAAFLCHALSALVHVPCVAIMRLSILPSAVFYFRNLLNINNKTKNLTESINKIFETIIGLININVFWVCTIYLVDFISCSQISKYVS